MTENIEFNKLREVLERYKEQFKLNVANILQMNGNVASGKLIDTIGQEFNITITDDWLSLEVSMEDYYLYLDAGTQPHWAPIQPIKDWIAVKGLPLNPYAVRANIAKYGTKAHPYLEEAKTITENQLLDEVAYAIEEDFGDYVEALLNDVSL